MAGQLPLEKKKALVDGDTAVAPLSEANIKKAIRSAMKTKIGVLEEGAAKRRSRDEIHIMETT